MNCDQIEQHSLLRRLLDGGMPADEKRPLQDHITGCEACQSALKLTASLMLQEPLPEGRTEAALEPQPSLLARAQAWLFPNGVGVWQPALAFAAVIVVALPMLSVWLPADHDTATGGTTWRAGAPVEEVSPLDAQLRGALEALGKGEAEQAFSMLDSRKVNWDRGRMGNVFTAYRARARAASELGWADAALQDLNRAMSFAELDPQRVACVEQDIKAVRGDGDFCALPASTEIH